MDDHVSALLILLVCLLLLIVIILRSRKRRAQQQPDHLPAHRALVGIQPAAMGWGNDPTPVVAKAVPEAAARVLEIIRGWQAEARTSL